MQDSSFLLFAHSLLRWLVLLSVAGAAIVSWRGLVLKTPIMVWERSLSIIAMVVCHVQLVTGLILYAIKFRTYVSVKEGGAVSSLGADVIRYWKFEHIGMMVIAILLVTLGRILSKRAKAEGAKQLLVAMFYTAGLLLMLWSIPWPFTEVGRSRGWV